MNTFVPAFLLNTDVIHNSSKIVKEPELIVDMSIKNLVKRGIKMLKSQYFREGFLQSIAVLKKNRRSKRISSWDRTGGNHDWISIASNKSSILAEIEGAGCIKHLYMVPLSLDPFCYRDLVIRIYWDGEKEPSVEVPMGDFFGIGHCKVRYFTSLLLCVNPGDPRIGTQGLNCYFPMPFSEGMKMEVANESEHPLDALWYHIDYQEYNEPDEELGRFHAQWRRENPTKVVRDSLKGKNTQLWNGINLTGKENYVILEAEGQGQLVGLLMNVDNIAGGWWGEGDDMVFIDGEKWPPSLHGTGTEEIFGGGACPNIEYAGPYTGFHLISNPDWEGKNSMYRFFLTDPIRFNESIKYTIEHGHANNFENDYSSVAYWYQAEPHRGFPPLLPAEKRYPLLLPAAQKVTEKQIQVSRQFHKKGKLFHEYPWEDIQQLFSLREKANNAFDKGEYKAALEMWDSALQIFKK